MAAIELNDSMVLDQLRQHWQKIALLILWKLNGRKPVEITHEDLKRFQKESDEQGGAVLLTHGKVDRFVFQVLSEAEAKQAAELHKTMSGRA